MDLDALRRILGSTPHMTFSQGCVMRDLILENEFERVLELGFLHGVSTCYIASALRELGRGHVTTIDREGAREAEPNVEHLLAESGLSDLVTVHYEPTSYVWRLMRMLEASPQPRFDLCYVDGAHNWYTDGFAFFLVDRLLEPGGMIVFDDLDWTYASSPALKGTPRVRDMPAEERVTPQIRKVYELLVKTHPDYGEFLDKDGWAYARKLTAATEPTVRTEVVHRNVELGLGAVLLKILKRLRSKR